MEEILSKIGVVDVVLLVVLLFGLIVGFVKGFAKQFGKLLNLCLSIGVGLILYQKAAEFIYSRTIMQQPIAESLALFVLLVTSSLIIKLFLIIISKVVTIQFVYFIERVGGALIGGLRYALLICYIANLILLWPSDYIEPYFSEKSYSGRVIMEVIPTIQGYTDPLKERVFGQEQIEEIASAPQADAVSND